MKTTNNTKYTLKDCGCYVDGARGIYAIERILAIAREHGAQIEHDCKDYAQHPIESCEFFGEYEDDCDSFMNDNFAVENAYWGRNENGDWGLWEMDDYEQHKFN